MLSFECTVLSDASSLLLRQLWASFVIKAEKEKESQELPEEEASLNTLQMMC